MTPHPDRKGNDAMTSSRPTVARLISTAGVALAMLVLLITVIGPASGVAARTTAPRTLDRFMWALAQQESGGDYLARNRFSGAYGKYQIMPFNWPAWSRRYLGNAHAKPTPANQEKVARGKVASLYRWLGSYELVAHWWFTGSSDPDKRTWSSIARRYVANVLTLMGRAPDLRAGSPATPARPRVPNPGSGGPGARPGALVRWTTGWLNFRAGPGIGSPRIGPALRPGTRLVVLATRHIAGSRDWLRVRLPNDRVGWVSSRYTRA
jgi:hypothetical protein